LGLYARRFSEKNREQPLAPLSMKCVTVCGNPLVTRREVLVRSPKDNKEQS